MLWLATRSLLICLSLLGLPASARALVIVTYDFDSTNSTLSITSPVPVSIPGNPPTQGTFSGSIEIAFSSNGLSTIEGPATLQVFNLSADLTLSANLGGPVTLTGPADAALMGPVSGVLTGNQLDFDPPALASFRGFGTVTCVGLICGSSSGVPKDFDATGNVPLSALTLGSIHGNLVGLKFGAVTATLSFVAPEVSRVLATPEPSLALLMVAVTGALLISRAMRRTGARR